MAVMLTPRPRKTSACMSPFNDKPRDALTRQYGQPFPMHKRSGITL
jgi:hypothetical protein